MSELEPNSNQLLPCPFCGGKALYEGYHNVDGFDVPVMFCNWCKSMFTVEGIEDFVGDGPHDGMKELRTAWNRRAQ